MTATVDWTGAFPKRPGPPRPTRAADIPPHLLPLLPLLAAGHPRYRIAFVLGVPRACAESRIARLYKLLGAHDRAQAVRIARETGLLPDNPKET